MACRRGCATCCTQNVTMTTLEGHRIIQYLGLHDQDALCSVVPGTSHAERYISAITTNEFAIFCFKGEDPPEEQNGQPGMPCRFLSNNECMIYDARPFGCGCFFSTQPCQKEACALVDPFLLTVNTVFLQFIEHLDRGGFFGNLNDVLAFLKSADQHGSPNSSIRCQGLSRNKTIPGLLIPPEHQKHMEPILVDLKRIAF